MRHNELVNLQELFELPLNGPYGNGKSSYHGVSLDFDNTVIDSDSLKLAHEGDEESSGKDRRGRKRRGEKRTAAAAHQKTADHKGKVKIVGGLQCVSWAESIFFICRRDTRTAVANEEKFRDEVQDLLCRWFSHQETGPLVPLIFDIVVKYHRLPDAIFNLIPETQQKFRTFSRLDRETQVVVRKAFDDLLCAFRRPFMIGEVKADPSRFILPGAITFARRNHEMKKKVGLCTRSPKDIATPLLQVGFGFERSELLIPRPHRVFGENIPNKAIGNLLVAYYMDVDPSQLAVADDRLQDVRSAITLEELKNQANHRFFDPHCNEWAAPRLDKVLFRKFIAQIRGAFRGIVIAGHDSTPERTGYILDQFSDLPPNSFRIVPGLNYLTL